MPASDCIEIETVKWLPTLQLSDSLVLSSSSSPHLSLVITFMSPKMAASDSIYVCVYANLSATQVSTILSSALFCSPLTAAAVGCCCFSCKENEMPRCLTRNGGWQLSLFSLVFIIYFLQFNYCSFLFKITLNFNSNR